MSKKKYSLKENIETGFIAGGYIALNISFLVFLSCFFWYPSFFGVTITTFFVGAIVGDIIDVSINGMYENWGLHGAYRILLPELCLYFFLFFFLHILKWQHFLNIEIEWAVLSVLGASSILVTSIFGGIIMRLETIKSRRIMKEIWEERERDNSFSI